MSDSVIIILIVAIAIIVVLLIFRKQLSNFQFKGGKNGVEMEIKTRKEDKTATPKQTDMDAGGVSVSGNKLVGSANEIKISGNKNARVDGNEMRGEKQKITVKPESKRK